MSAEAMGHAFRCSPYEGATAAHAVLLAIADTVNDTYGNRLFAGQTEIAAKARVSQRRVGGALRQLEADGWLRKLKNATATEPAEYEFVIDHGRPTKYEPRSARRPDTASTPDTASPPDAPSTPDAASPPDTASTHPLTQRPVRGDAASTEPKGTQGGTQEGSATPRPVAASCDLVRLESADGEYVIAVDPRDPDRSFDKLWDRYPRHPKTSRLGGGGDRRLALDRWRALPIKARAEALTRVDWYAADCVAAGRQPQQLEVWIRRRRWESIDSPPAQGADGLDEFELAVASLCGLSVEHLTGEERGELVTVAGALTAAGADEAQLADMGRRWRKQWPDIPITRQGLLRHWSRFAVAQSTGGARAVAVCPKCKQPKAATSHDAQCDRIAQIIAKEPK